MAGDKDDIQSIIEGHLRYKQSRKRDREFYKNLASGKQRPRMLWIGCSDSRVIPSKITGADPGALFVIRNIANIVPPAHSGDDSVGAAIEYCVVHLGVDDIVICGHSGCGGVKALGEAVSDEREAHLKRWIEFARPSLGRVGLDSKTDNGALLAAVKANVLVQRDNLLTYACVQEAFGQDKIRLHCWLYDMEHGDLLTYDDTESEWCGLLDDDMEKKRGSWFSRLMGASKTVSRPDERGS